MADYLTALLALHELTGLQVAYKDNSWLMKVLAKILFFNKGFMTKFTTTLGSTVYFPSEEYVSENPRRAVSILMHEAVHVHDSKKLTPVPFSLLYLSPQILALGALSAFWVGWGALLCLLFLAPIPSPGRAWLEARAYAMNVLRWPEGAHEIAIAAMKQPFRGWDYYKMDPKGRLSERWLVRYHQSALSDPESIQYKIRSAILAAGETPHSS